jgi:hypothetical protein
MKWTFLRLVRRGRTQAVVHASHEQERAIGNAGGPSVAVGLRLPNVRGNGEVAEGLRFHRIAPMTKSTRSLTVRSSELAMTPKLKRCGNPAKLPSPKEIMALSLSLTS